MTDPVDRQMASVLGHYVCPRLEDTGACNRPSCMFLHPRAGILGTAFKIVKRAKPFPRSVCLVHTETRECIQTNEPVLGSDGQEFYSCSTGYHPTLRQFADLSKFFVEIGAALHRLIGPQTLPCPNCSLSTDGDEVGVFSHCDCYYHVRCATVAFLLNSTVTCVNCRITSSYFIPWKKAVGPPTVAKKAELARIQRTGGLVNELNRLAGADGPQRDNQTLREYDIPAMKRYYRRKITPALYDPIKQMVRENRLLAARMNE